MNILLTMIGAFNMMAVGGMFGVSYVIGLPKDGWFWPLIIANLVLGAWCLSLGAGYRFF
jgi:hypothetical protein